MYTCRFHLTDPPLRLGQLCTRAPTWIKSCSEAVRGAFSYGTSSRSMLLFFIFIPSLLIQPFNPLKYWSSWSRFCLKVAEYQELNTLRWTFRGHLGYFTPVYTFYPFIATFTINVPEWSLPERISPLLCTTSDVQLLFYFCCNSNRIFE